ncbi:hypothetical protein K470DRAFT_259803 [Piedraia hortae CBS 480.64]|uniref:Velvet domain-containing protein n=1 Tax=Piedraia hortae CBS 480.64 TaxID=1314780 RepID=A0A6A7BUW5_9PEZI|nr:hypothetical protein K470DRAFT_259803 [Piedraia hortae CBS 480.64]
MGLAIDSREPPEKQVVTSNRISRITNDGHEILYVLKVIQQPSRARACGSGAKASADRRPVDPPPILQLKIYDGDREDPSRDITCSLDASIIIVSRCVPAYKSLRKTS